MAVGIRSGMRQERYEFVGKIDPASGVRCRFTLSSAWQSADQPLHLLDTETGMPTRLDHYVCTLRPSHLSQWVARRLLHRRPMPSPEIRLTTYKSHDLAAFSFFHHFLDGYPEPVLENQERVLAHRHLRIDGCPATVVHLEKTQAGQVYQGTQLLVDAADHTTVYDLSGFNSAASDAVDQEMQAILASFHVEQVATPEDGKPQPLRHTT